MTTTEEEQAVATTLGGARGGLFGRWRRFALLQAAGARGALASAVEAKGLYRQALKPVGLDAAGLGVSSADCKAAS